VWQRYRDDCDPVYGDFDHNLDSIADLDKHDDATGHIHSYTNTGNSNASIGCVNPGNFS
jgi:hypothetical protein